MSQKKSDGLHTIPVMKEKDCPRMMTSQVIKKTQGTETIKFGHLAQVHGKCWTNSHSGNDDVCKVWNATHRRAHNTSLLHLHSFKGNQKSMQRKSGGRLSRKNYQYGCLWSIPDRHCKGQTIFGWTEIIGKALIVVTVKISEHFSRWERCWKKWESFLRLQRQIAQNLTQLQN